MNAIKKLQTHFAGAYFFIPGSIILALNEAMRWRLQSERSEGIFLLEKFALNLCHWSLVQAAKIQAMKKYKYNIEKISPKYNYLFSFYTFCCWKVTNLFTKPIG